MTSSLRSVNLCRPATAALSIPAKRSRHILPFAAASLAALVLSACGGGDGSGSSVDAAQGSEGASDFRSFVSVNPQVRAAIEATPVATKQMTTKATDEAGVSEQAADETSNDPSDSGNTSSTEDGINAAASEESPSSSSSSILDTLVGEMSKMNDHPLKDVNSKYGFSRGPGYVLSGPNSGGSNFLLPWFVTFEGEGNSARNTRVEMRNLRLIVKSSSSGQWTTLLNSDTFSGIQCEQSGNYWQCPQQASVQGGEGSASSLPVSNLNLHGWWGARAPIQGWDLDAIVVTLEARLIVNETSGTDDRSNAKYLVHVGADYYPEDASPTKTLAPAGVSRAKMVTTDWQTFGLTTLNDVGLQEPGGGISEAEFRADPPPLN